MHAISLLSSHGTLVPRLDPFAGGWLKRLSRHKNILSGVAAATDLRHGQSWAAGFTSSVSLAQRAVTGAFRVTEYLCPFFGRSCLERGVGRPAEN